MNDFFSLNAFLLGISFAVITVPLPFIYEWLGNYWGIRVTKFSIFTPMFGKPILHKTKRGHTHYSIGMNWMSMSAGYWVMDADDLKVETVAPEEEKHTYFHQPKSRKWFIHSLSLIMWLPAALLALYAMDTTRSMDANAMDVAFYIRKLFQTLFADRAQWPEFRFYAAATIGGKNLVLFAIAVWSYIWVALSLFTLLIKDNDSGPKVFRIIKLVLLVGVILGYVYLLFWKLLPFALVFYAWTDLLRFVFSGLAGIYLMGFALYGLRILTLPPREFQHY